MSKFGVIRLKITTWGLLDIHTYIHTYRQTDRRKVAIPYDLLTTIANNNKQKGNEKREGREQTLILLPRASPLIISSILQSREA